MGHRFKATRRNPALRLLVDGLPRREVGGQHAPLGTGTDDPAQRVVHLADRVPALRRVFDHQTQIRGDKCPFIVGYIGRLGIAETSYYRTRVPFGIPDFHVDERKDASWRHEGQK